nr:hypothetical protein [Tanacetum cinerariifolium]
MTTSGSGPRGTSYMLFKLSSNALYTSASSSSTRGSFFGTSSATNSSIDLRELTGLCLFDTEPDLDFFVGFGAGESGSLPVLSAKYLSCLATFAKYPCTELEISKNRFFIGQVKQRVRSWIELVLPLKVIDDQLGKPDTRNHHKSGLLFPIDGMVEEAVKALKKLMCFRMSTAIL